MAQSDEEKRRYKTEWMRKKRATLQAIGDPGKEQRDKKRQEWILNNRGNLKEYNRKYNLVKFNMTVEQYNRVLKRQGGACAICKQPEINRALAVDHEINDSGILLRGLLCTNCNTGLGKFKDNIEFLQAAIDYLKKFR